MSRRNTIIRALHDLGLAAWFGGSLMGAVGVNGAAQESGSQTRTARIASAGWAKWAPWNGAAIAIHLIGGAALAAANRKRMRQQRGVGASTAAKTVLTAAALAATGYSRVLGKKIEKASSSHPGEAAQADRVPVSSRASTSYATCSGASRCSPRRWKSSTRCTVSSNGAPTRSSGCCSARPARSASPPEPDQSR